MKILLYTVFDFLIGFLIQSSKAFYRRDNNSIVQGINKGKTSIRKRP
jgi:hypothetical protein